MNNETNAQTGIDPRRRAETMACLQIVKVFRATSHRSPDGAQRNPGGSRKKLIFIVMRGCPRIALSLHPGYAEPAANTCRVSWRGSSASRRPASSTPVNRVAAVANSRRPTATMLCALSTSMRCPGICVSTHGATSSSRRLFATGKPPHLALRLEEALPFRRASPSREADGRVSWPLPVIAAPGRAGSPDNGTAVVRRSPAVRWSRRSHGRVVRRDRTRRSDSPGASPPRPSARRPWPRGW